MSLLSAVELLELVKDGVIENVDRSAINAASIDLYLGDNFFKEGFGNNQYKHLNIVHLKKRERPSMVNYTKEVFLDPGEFCLAATKEIFHLPNNVSGSFILKSSMGRAGLDHAMSGWADSGFNGSVLTLELCNTLRNHILHLEAGMAIGQMIFFKHTEVPEEFLYSTKGRYNNDRTVQQMK